MIDFPAIEPVSAEWVSAIAAVLGLVIAAGAVYFAFAQLRLTAQQVRDAATHAAEDSEARTRPYIGMDVQPSLWGAPYFDLIIENRGATTARRIRIALASGPFRSLSDHDDVSPTLARVFAKPFDLAPGARRRVAWHLGENPAATPPGASGAPAADEVVATYEWEPDGDRDSRQYRDAYSYDVTDLAAVVPIPTSGPRNDHDKTAPDKNLIHVLGAIAEHIGWLRR